MTPKYLCSFICALLLSLTVYGQSFVNGGLEGPIASTSSSSAIPTGWTNVPHTNPISIASQSWGATADLISVSGFNTTNGAAGIPNSGVTSVSAFKAKRTYTNGAVAYWDEGIQQTVNCLIVGETYKISFYQTVVRADNKLDPQGSWGLYVDNNLEGTSVVSTSTLAYDDLNLVWDYRELFFTATATSHNFQFMVMDDDANIDLSYSDINGALRMGIDDITIEPAVPLVSPAGPFCNNDLALSLSATAGGGTWSGTGIINTATGEFDPNVAGTGTHTITYTIPGACTYVGTQDIVVNNCALPIELLTFDANEEGHNKVRLDWTTVSENNNDYFTLERSKDAVNFEEFAIIQGAGNHTGVLNYIDYDNTPHRGVSYYRLKQTDFNGTYTYSDIRTVAFDDLAFINLYPNPSEGEVEISVAVNKDGVLNIEILDMLGRVAFQESHAVEQGLSSVKVNTSQLAQGVYSFRINTNDTNHISKEFIRN